MKKNILIIDDSALMRRVLSDIINSDGQYQVKGTATNGIEALDILKVQANEYDILLLDINMPKMSGIAFLEEMNRLGIKVTTIIVSTLAKEGASETIRALELGAFDFVTKPDSFSEAKGDTFRKRILHTISVALGGVPATEDVIEEVIHKSSVETTVDAAKTKRSFARSGKLVALACSTGGPRALQSVIPSLPASLDAPVLIVQHMPEGFTKSLACRLNEMSEIQVKEAEDDEKLQKGVVYIAKGGCQMRLKKCMDGNYRLSVTRDTSQSSLKPCADIMYESLVDTDFSKITCVVLTGMGGDGTRGIKQLKKTSNIYAIAQNEKTCTVYGMPKMLIDAGLANEIVPLDEVADAIANNVGVR